MLIHVDQTVADAIRGADGHSSKAVRFLEYIGMAYREGKHLVSGASKTLNEISRSDKLTKSTCGAFKTIASRAAETNGLRHVLPFYVVSGHGTEFLNTFTSGIQQRVLRLDVDWFDDSAVVQPSLLLTENRRDAELYIELARFLVEANNWNIRLQLEPHGAGGSNTAREFAALVRAKRACLCIVDSDRCCPDCQLGATAKAVLRVNRTWGVHQAIIPESRELENLIPTSLFRLAMAEINFNGVEQYSELADISVLAPLYIDLKSGTRAGQLELSNPALPANHFWSAIDAQLGLSSARYRHCGDIDACDVADCSCVLVPGFGDSILDRVLALLRSQFRTLLRTISLVNCGNLERLCLDVVAFGCSSAPARA